MTLYARYIQKSKKWQRKRRQRLELDNYTCQNRKCGSHENLTVHHLTYERLYNERMEDLQTLCRPCHEDEEKRKNEQTVHSRSV